MKVLINYSKLFIIFILLLVLLIIILGVPNIFAELQPTKSVEIFSEDLNYKENEAGAWKVTKSAKWIGKGLAEVTFNVDTIEKLKNTDKDMILVLDVSGSMAGERIERLRNDSIKLLGDILENNNNRVALISFDSTSEIVSDFSNDYDFLVDKIYSLNAKWMTNYYQAFLSVEELLKNYNFEEERECVVIFLTDGYPNVETPNEVGQFLYLRNKYPKLKVNAIQYEMGSNILEEIKRVSDNQFSANSNTLYEILSESSSIAAVYDKFEINDIIDTNYFIIESVDDVDYNVGSIVFNDRLDKIKWSLDGLKSGSTAELKVKVRLKEDVDGNIFPTNDGEKIISKIMNSSENVNSKLTPILLNRYEVKYDSNFPADCKKTDVIRKGQYSVFETIEMNVEVLSCDGYQFKGWRIALKDIEMVNDDYFIMPESDVEIKGVWSKLDIKKSMSGTIKESLTMYKQVQQDFDDSNKYVKKYAGDTTTFNGNEDVYYYYGEAANNNVVFANYCWKIVRTTDTGGVKLLYNGVPAADGSCNNSGVDSQLTANQMGVSSNTVSYNTKFNSVGDVGYMYDINSRYEYAGKWISFSQTVLSNSKLSETESYYYSDTYAYSLEDYRFYLDNPVQYALDDDNTDLIGKFTFKSTSPYNRAKSLYYVLDADKDYIYYITITESNAQVNEYETTITFSDSLTENGDGSYTLTNPKVVDISKWYTEYALYNNYYTCGNNDLTCDRDTIKYLISTNNSSFNYYVLGNNFKYGNSFTWDGENYTLDNEIAMWKIDIDTLSNHHYTCFNNEGRCESLNYVFYSLGEDNATWVHYIKLRDGKSIEDALNEMLYSDTVNKVSSNIKMSVDYWYQNNMINYTDYLEDTVWCNDRSFLSNENGWNPNGGKLKQTLQFKSDAASYSDLSCINRNDRFTVNLENGNGALQYPTGLLTRGEQELALSGTFYNYKSPLASGARYWGMAPSSYTSFSYGANVSTIRESGIHSGSYLGGNFGVRPSVSLRTDIEYSSGDGSADQPYVVLTD